MWSVWIENRTEKEANRFEKIYERNQQLNEKRANCYYRIMFSAWILSLTLFFFSFNFLISFFFFILINEKTQKSECDLQIENNGNI